MARILEVSLKNVQEGHDQVCGPCERLTAAAAISGSATAQVPPLDVRGGLRSATRRPRSVTQHQARHAEVGVAASVGIVLVDSGTMGAVVVAACRCQTGTLRTGDVAHGQTE